MENNKKQNSNRSENEPRNEQNETLNHPGASVADYGNVTGGSAVENQPGKKSNENRSGEKETDTIGNP